MTVKTAESTATEASTDNSDVYSDGDTYETFDDLGDDIFDGGDDITGELDGDDEGEEAPKAAPKKAPAKKDPKKEARGQKSDDIETVDNSSDSEEEEEEVEAPAEEEEEEAPAEEGEEAPAEGGKPKGKGKPTYVTVDGETYALDSNAVISTQVDGKTEKVTLQELKNNYAGKVSYDKKFNEVNLKEQAHKRAAAEFEGKVRKFDKVKTDIEAIIKDPSKDPEDALKIFLDAFDIDSYDLVERSFKSKLTELANVLNMEPDARKAHFLEKKNSHLQSQAEKREARRQEEEKRNSYRQKADALRKSSGVSEAQYVDAYEELKSYGYEDKDLTEKDIVEWAATKPHRETVDPLLKPYKDQFSDDAFGELKWKLAKILQSGTETPETIKKHLAEVYGVPTEVKELSKKLKPLGRKSAGPAKKSPTPAKKYEYESFEDLEEDDW